MYLWIHIEDETMELKEHLIDGLHYVLLHTEAWEALFLCYGIIPGQVSEI